MQKFVAYKNDKAGVDKLNEFFFGVCQSRNLPYVAIRQRTKYCDVLFDYIAFNKDTEKLLIKNKEIVKSGALALFHKYSDKKSEYEISALLVTLSNIPIENGEQCALELHGIISEAIATH